MSTFKKFTSNDIIVTPFTVNKHFSFEGDPPGYSTSSIFVTNGRNQPIATDGSEPIGTGSLGLVYRSIKHLYYSNYLSGSNGEISKANITNFNSDGTISGPFYTTNYENQIQSISEKRTFVTASNDRISVLNIPQNLFGQYIKPGSFSSSQAMDDGQGNLIDNTSTKVGNIIYKDGIIVYINTFVAFSNPQWESTLTTYETQYKCIIRSNELNYSLNPSLLTTYGSGSILNSGSATYKDFVTGSNFSPYITTVGLYDDAQNLLAVAKLAQPLQSSQTTDTTILINIDR